MPERPSYCHVVDVVRKFDPTVTESDIDSNDFLTNQDREQIRARIDAVGSELEQSTGQAWRLTRVGAKGAPETYEYQEASSGQHPREPMRVSLDHRQVLPIDSAEDDVIEIRDGKDSWEDVTSQSGDEFVLDHRTGTLKLYRRLLGWIYWDAPDDRYLRASYRHGALGGDQSLGGQTTLDGSLSSSATSVDVTNAKRLPARGIVLLGNDEYVRVTDVDRSNDTLTVSRGEQATSESSHDDGDTVHYCPEYIRDGVAAKTARELQIYDDYVDQLTQTGDGLAATAKLEAWQQAWKRILEQESDVRKL